MMIKHYYHILLYGSLTLLSNQAASPSKSVESVVFTLAIGGLALTKAPKVKYRALCDHCTIKIIQYLDLQSFSNMYKTCTTFQRLIDTNKVAHQYVMYQPRWFCICNEFKEHDERSFPKDVGMIQNICLDQRAMIEPKEANNNLSTFVTELERNQLIKHTNGTIQSIDTWMHKVSHEIKAHTTKNGQQSPEPYLAILQREGEAFKAKLRTTLYSEDFQEVSPIFSPVKLCIDATALECYELGYISLKKLQEVTFYGLWSQCCVQEAHQIVTNAPKLQTLYLHLDGRRVKFCPLEDLPTDKLKELSLYQPDAKSARQVAQKILARAPNLSKVTLYLDVKNLSMVNFFTQKSLYPSQSLQKLSIYLEQPNLQVIEAYKKGKNRFIHKDFPLSKLAIHMIQNKSIPRLYSSYFLLKCLHHNISPETLSQVYEAFFLKGLLPLLNLEKVQYCYLDFYHGRSESPIGLQGIRDFFDKQKHLKARIHIRCLIDQIQARFQGSPNIRLSVIERPPPSNPI